jgi:uncharacterized protein (DUF427 family)
MPKATWNGVVLAESDRCERVDGNDYFPPDSIRREHFRPSDAHTVCPWKGQASYYDIVVNGQENTEAAWYYPSAKPKAKHFEGYVAFWKGVTVEP